MKIQSFKDYIVEQEKNFLDETIGILYSPDNNLLFIGSNLDSSINFTIDSLELCGRRFSLVSKLSCFFKEKSSKWFKI